MIVLIKKHYKDEDYVAEYDVTDEELKQCLVSLLENWYRNFSVEFAFNEIVSDYTIPFEEGMPQTYEELVDKLDLTQNYEFLDEVKEDIEEYFNNKY